MPSLTTPSPQYSTNMAEPTRTPMTARVRSGLESAARWSPATWIPLVRIPHTASGKAFELPMAPGPAVEYIKAQVEGWMAVPPPAPRSGFFEARSLCQTMIVQTCDAEKGRIVVWCVLPRGWLDVMEFEAVANGTTGGATVRGKSWSTGFLPLTVAGALFWNCLLCWIAFVGVNKFRLHDVRKKLLASLPQVEAAVA